MYIILDIYEESYSDVKFHPKGKFKYNRFALSSDTHGSHAISHFGWKNTLKQIIINS